jgi:SAM-dependent methyltransferase
MSRRGSAGRDATAEPQAETSTNLQARRAEPRNHPGVQLGHRGLSPAHVAVEAGADVAAFRHPIFARVFDGYSRRAEARGRADHRRELLAGLEGYVLEVGAGNGLNFAHYPATVTEVVAIEPEPYLRARAEQAARSAPVPVRVKDGVAEALFAEGTFDAAVASLLLCSLSDPARALDELFVAIRPGGELRYYEHVRGRSPRLARLQRAADVVWPRLAGGCHLSRDSEGMIEVAGFVIEARRGFSYRPSRLAALASPHVLGVARRPATGAGR